MLSHETKATEEQKETKAMSITEAVFQNEEAFLLDIAGVLEAIDTYETYAVHPVIREGKTIFSFRIRGLGEDEMEK